MAKTKAHTNRAIRQEALRDQLSSQKHVQQVTKIYKKMAKLKPSKNAAFTLNKYCKMVDIQFRLINKYLPDIKQTEITGEDGGPLTINVISYKDA